MTIPLQHPTFADLLRWLFEQRRRRDGRPYTLTDVAQGVGVSVEYIRELRSGGKDNPSREILLRLCNFFQVPPAYFFPELDALVPRFPPLAPLPK